MRNLSVKVYTNASKFAIGGVLMQSDHLIAFESRKLKEAKRHHPIQEKKTTIIVHYLRNWRHYLLGSHFLILTNNVTTGYFQTQKKLTPKQVKWQDFLVEFYYDLEYKPS